MKEVLAEFQDAETGVVPLQHLPEFAEIYQKTKGNLGRTGNAVKFTQADVKELIGEGYIDCWAGEQVDHGK